MKQRGPIDLSRLRVLPLAQRESLTQADEILIAPDSTPPTVPSELADRIVECAAAVRSARQRNASVMLIYGAHLLRNGAARLVERLLACNWVTHLATNGAGTIHDWEYAWFGASTESVRMNVAQGQFGTWDETASNISNAGTSAPGSKIWIFKLPPDTTSTRSTRRIARSPWIGH